MDNTYLIFFGKSQDFTFHAFDSRSYINNFNRIIKDFDELESKIFTIDDPANTQILSKYVFSQNGKNYSLLKLYSMAQAYDGSRISGSIYGVGLLSERDIKISEANIEILNTTKKYFAQLSLNGLKFKASNFLPDVENIWKALVNHEAGNYLNRIDFNNSEYGKFVNEKIRSFWVSDIFKDSVELDSEITNASRLYFSDDINHLKRTQNRWGSLFPIYYKENGTYRLYKEKQDPEPPQNLDSSQSTDQETAKYAELEIKLNALELKYGRLKQSATRKILIASIMAAAFCLISLLLFIGNLFSIAPDDKPKQPITAMEVEPRPSLNQTPANKIVKQNESTLNISDILDSAEKRETLKKLIVNIGLYEKSGFTSQDYYNPIKRDAGALNINIDFLETHREEKQKNK